MGNDLQGKMVDLEERRLGEDATLVELSSAGENRAVSLAMAQQARRGIQILTRDLDRALYDNIDFVEALATLVRRHRNAQVRILVMDSSPAVANGHRLIDLAQRLSSSIHVHNPAAEQAEVNQAFLLADAVGFIRRTQADRYDAVASFHAPVQARELTQGFEQMWERSMPDPQLRRLFI